MKTFRINTPEAIKNVTGEKAINNLANDVIEHSKLLSEVKAVHPSDFFLSFEDYDGKLTYHHLEVFLIDEDGNPTVKVKYYKNHYSFFNPIYHTLKKLTTWDREKVEGILTRPQNVGIGKLTLKKLNNWVKFLDDEITELKKLSEVNTKVGEDYRKKIAPYNPKYHITNANRGEVTINKVTLEFEICDSFVSEKIKIDCSSNFENFLKLSNNGFNS